nr:uncharacterized protein LOC130541180 [Pan paniscus]
MARLSNPLSSKLNLLQKFNLLHHWGYRAAQVRGKEHRIRLESDAINPHSTSRAGIILRPGARRSEPPAHWSSDGGSNFGTGEKPGRGWSASPGLSLQRLSTAGGEK